MIAEALNLINNNCTNISIFKEEQEAFCAKKSFSLLDLSLAMRSVDFLGATGPVSFYPGSLSRKTAFFEVWQYNASGVPVMLGTMRTENSSLIVNTSLAQFPGKYPISSKNGA